jgi:hypothetical protein
MPCVIVLDRRGDLHAATISEHASPRIEARKLIKNLGLDDTPGEVFAYGYVEETDDPGAARIIGRTKVALGQFKMTDPT